MTRTLIGTVEVRDGRAVCIRPDGTVYGGTLLKDVTAFACFGGLRRYDSGKRIWRVDGVLQMENDAQRDRRLGRMKEKIGR